jgi:hypothetical protein
MRDAVLVAASSSRAQTASAGAGFVERHRSAGGVLEDVQTGPGAYNATANLDSSSEWIIQMVALRPR